MKERPILFSAPMVRALLAGTKTQTRRVVKLSDFGRSDTPGYTWTFRDNQGRVHDIKATATLIAGRCPYGEYGDRLWVRESFMLESNYGLDNEEGYPPPFKDGRPIKRDESPDWGKWWTQAHYAATDPKPELCKDSGDDRMAGWKPSIHMPRWASRITLEITGVRVERLHAISETDAITEGIDAIAAAGWRNYLWHGEPNAPAKTVAGWSHQYSNYLTDPVGSYSSLWESINGPGSWNANPWVWVVEFKRIDHD